MLERFSKRIPLLSRLEPHMKEVIEKGSAVFLLRILATGLGFLFNVLIARLFGAEGTGVYYLALTVTSIATVLSRVGLDNTLIRFISASKDQGKWSQVAGVYRQGMRVAATVSFAVAAVIFAAAPWIAATVFSEPGLTPLLRIMSLGIIPSTLVILHAQSLKAVAKPGLAAVIEATGISLLNVLLIFPLSRAFGLSGIAATYVATQSCLLLAGWYLWRRATPDLRDVRGAFDLRLLLITSWPLLWVASMNLIMKWTDTFMLGIWTSAEDVGVYGVAMRTASLTSFVLTAVNSVVAPKFAVMYAQSNLKGLESLAQNSAKLMAALALPLFLLFVLFPGWVMRVFGDEFAQGALVLAILAAGQFINVATGSVGYLLMMTGREKLMQYNIIGAALLNLVLNLLLIPSFGITGAAAATAVTLAGMNVVAATLVYKELSIMTLPLPFRSRFNESP